MKQPKLKYFKSPFDLANEIQRRAEIILSGNRINTRRVDFNEVFFVGTRNGFMTFKGNRDFTLANKPQDEWVISEEFIAACARHLACREMKAARQQSLDSIISQLERAQHDFLEKHDYS